MSTATAFLKQEHHATGLGFKIWVAILGLFLALGVASGVYVLINGLGVTGLTDRVPWGVWIVLDISAIGLGAGAFTLSAIVYLLHIKHFESIARAAVLVGFLGYSSAMLALFVDIGRPDRFWHPIVFWNVHSVLWEITMCVILYFTVLLVELAPVLFESRLFAWWPAAPKVGHLIHRATPVAAVLGLALSLLHQSSLGATYGVVAARPLWYKPSLPVLFILAAIAGGMSATLLGTLLVSRLRGCAVAKCEVLWDMAKIAGAALLGYLYLKLWDWAATTYYSNVPAREAGLALLRNTTPYGESFWWIEVLFGALVPAIIFLTPRLRRNGYLLMVACALAMIGVVTMRWNVSISGLVIPQDWSPGVAFLFPRLAYNPTLPEFGVLFGIVAYMLLGFTLAVRYLPIYPDAQEVGEEQNLFA